MRIIGGSLRGTRIITPGNLPVRPTTDLSKEALFNILNNQIEFDQVRVLDLFSGTGNISLEFASRGAPEILSVDLSYHCAGFLKQTAAKLGLNTIRVQKADVFKFLRQLPASQQFDLVFADAPFDHPKLNQLPAIVFAQGILGEKGLLIIEHPSSIKFDHVVQFREQRKYGYSSFSFFRNS